ncbi:protein lifeguard 2-like [Peromyscus leucopus]|uniref:protein lifeguard 2-like n=1 Tax=Peromyscus leucopus TaxID=10041 RepID=UPI0010A0D020|nr:protein lifeguard 2-like [Peromyscus leucopus]XP_037059418.1 protein lifeguard 2-like [Peromyscus leucopus]XP_037059419.1 protein lifeguard 2-like [Peromyscus leucopus]
MKIDLEVSEPINFSSGDHQHLVQKAAIKSGHSKGDQPFTYSSRNTPQEAIKYPRSKQRDAANTYAVQISDDVISEETITGPPGPFQDMSVRKGFILKVFVVLSVQLLVTATIIGVFVFSKPLRKWVISVPWFIYALLPACFIVIIVLACCRDVRRQVPMNYILLALFTLLEGLLLGSMSVFYKAEEILWAAGATTIVTLALTLFALQTKWDFTLLNGVLFVCLCVLFVYGIITLVIRSYWLHLVYAALGTLLFSMYLVMDVQMMVGGRYHYEVDPEEYIFAALNIYVDIISLFIFILDLIAR